MTIWNASQTLEDPPYSKNIREVYLGAIERLVRPPKAILVPEWKLFNDAVGGFRPREFSILCGSTGSGKTTFLANLSAQLLKQRSKHFVMSVETGHTDYMTRILSVLEGRDLNTGIAVRPEAASAIHDRHGDLIAQGGIEFSLYEDRIPVEQLKSDLLFMREKRGCEIAFIDNLNFFLEVTSAANAVVEMDRVIHELIIFCKQVDIHIVMVMHPKKPDARSPSGTRVEDEFSIKGSSTAVQESHNIFLWNRPRKELIESGERTPFQRELTINKMRRRGSHTGKTIIFESEGTRYVERGLQ